MFLENWRPISLVNVDAKLMSKVTPNRIKKVLPNIIDCNQTGYVQDHYIVETIRSIFDIMGFTLLRKIPVMQIRYLLTFKNHLTAFNGALFLAV